MTPETAARLRAGLRADIRVVGVFVDAPPGEPEALNRAAAEETVSVLTRTLEQAEQLASRS